MPNLSADRASLDWIKTLLEELQRRRVDYDKRDAYYSGSQGERFVATGYRELFSAAFQFYRENVCKTVVKTVGQRLAIDGFRFPEANSDDTSATDADAWRIWQDNDLDKRSSMLHTEALVASVGYVLVSPFTDERVGPKQRSPKVTLEKATEAIVATAPGGTERLVGLKHWFDATVSRRYVTLYFPDRIEKFQSEGYTWANQHGSGYIETGGWGRRITPGEDWPLKHNLGVVPLIPIVNAPRLVGGLWAGIEGDSDIADVIPVQDAINFLALNGIVASDKAAFPQKWATGVEIPTKVDPNSWKPDIDEILSTRATDAKFGNFAVAQLEQYDGAIRGKLTMVAIQTSIPIHNFIPTTGQPASGEAREVSEVELTKKIEDRQLHFGEGWEEVIRLAFRQLGDDTRADDTACETVWRPAGVEPTASKVDALVKQRSLKVPFEVIWEALGHSASARAKFPAMLEKERKLFNSTPVATTQPDAVPAPGDQADPTKPPTAPPTAANPGPNAGKPLDSSGG